MTVFIPLPEGLEILTMLILILMFGAFYVASLFSLPEKLASSVFGVVLSVSSSLVFSACVVILTLILAVAVQGC